jgi:predicted permease
MGPIAMFLTGFVIGDFDLISIFKSKKVYIATLLRLIILPAFIITVLKLLGADTFILKLALFAYATPFGLNTVIFPAAYGGDANTGASMAMISHTFSVFTIPIMYALFTAIFL